MPEWYSANKVVLIIYVYTCRSLFEIKIFHSYLTKGTIKSCHSIFWDNLGKPSELHVWFIFKLDTSLKCYYLSQLSIDCHRIRSCDQPVYV